ncbi:MAG: extracellular solute-binding protein, partial [bacterium]
MSGKWYKLLALLLILGLALVACNGAEEEPSAGETGEEPEAVEEPVEEEPPAEDEPVEEPPAEDEAAVDEALEELPEGVTGLHLMGWSSSEAENTRLQAVVDDFNAANEDIEVVLNLVPDYDTRLQTSLAGGSPPDVFYIDSFRLPDLVDAGAVEPAEGRIDNPDDFY